MVAITYRDDVENILGYLYENGAFEVASRTSQEQEFWASSIDHSPSSRPLSQECLHPVLPPSQDRIHRPLSSSAHISPAPEDATRKVTLEFTKEDSKSHRDKNSTSIGNQLELDSGVEGSSLFNDRQPSVPGIYGTHPTEITQSTRLRELFKSSTPPYCPSEYQTVQCRKSLPGGGPPSSGSSSDDESEGEQPLKARTTFHNQRPCRKIISYGSLLLASFAGRDHSPIHIYIPSQRVPGSGDKELGS